VVPSLTHFSKDHSCNLATLDKLNFETELEKVKQWKEITAKYQKKA